MQCSPCIESLLGKRVLLRRTTVQKRVTRGFHYRGSVPIWKELTLEGEIVENSSMSLSPTLGGNEKVKHYIKMKTHKLIALRF